MRRLRHKVAGLVNVRLNLNPGFFLPAESMFLTTVLLASLFFFFIYFHQLEANYSTILQWFPSYIDMN